MNSLSIIFFLIISVSFGTNDLEKFVLPFNKEDLISINKKFGWQKNTPFLVGVRPKKYPGVNYEVKKGAPAIAIKSGIVESVRSTKYYGEHLIINHGNGVQAKYYHLKEIKAKAGDNVKKGDAIGTSSNYGLTTVNSIGLEIKLKETRINPSLLFESE